ncbi:hypothetical protein [Paeniglutamicibacter antarcticus]|uniref:DUF4352 domain-containing protein n=1 Tax=Paeniglutamicibacter antarcticus TaxID=494023 RepID=A0ABP9TMZ7_9MICC
MNEIRTSRHPLYREGIGKKRLRIISVVAGACLAFGFSAVVSGCTSAVSSESTAPEKSAIATPTTEVDDADLEKLSAVASETPRQDSPGKPSDDAAMSLAWPDDEAASVRDSPSAWKKVSDGEKIAPDARSAEKLPPKMRPVALDESVPAGSSATMKLDAIELTNGTADGIGEVSGPSVLVTISIHNEHTDSLDLSRAELNVLFGKDRQPMVPLSDPRASKLASGVEAGESTKTTFVFAVPSTKSNELTVEFNSGNDAEIQQLVGEVQR